MVSNLRRDGSFLNGFIKQEGQEIEQAVSEKLEEQIQSIGGLKSAAPKGQ